MAGLNINRINDYKLQGTRDAARKYCPDAFSQLGKVDFIFKEMPLSTENDYEQYGYTEKNGKRYNVVLSNDFYLSHSRERINTFCHEVGGHVNFMEQHPGVLNSKTEELYSSTKGEAAKAKYSEDMGVPYTPLSKEEIMKSINKNPASSCLPDKPVQDTSINRRKMAICYQKMKEEENKINSELLDTLNLNKEGEN